MRKIPCLHIITMTLLTGHSLDRTEKIVMAGRTGRIAIIVLAMIEKHGAGTALQVDPVSYNRFSSSHGADNNSCNCSEQCSCHG